MSFGLSAATVGLISAGAGLAGAVISSKAAGKAADRQAASAAASDATQSYQYDTTRADNAPFRETGLAANNRLAYLMGLPTAKTNGQEASGVADYGEVPNTYIPGQTSNALWERILGDFNTNHQAAFGTGMNRDWNADADSQRAKAALDQQYKDALGTDPQMQAQRNQQQQEEAAMQADPAYGSLMRNFTMADRDADPVYQSGLQFGLDQGTQGINRQAAAGGNFLSGATLKALTRFGNDYGSSKANESFNRFNVNQDKQANRLSGLMGAGQQATNQVSASGQNMANNISASQQGLGNALGASYIAQGNTWQNALNGGASALKGVFNGSGYGQNNDFFNGSGAWRL